MSEATRTVGRRQARRQALFLLYQWDLTGQPLASLFDGDPNEFAVQLAEAVSRRAEALDVRVTAVSDGWPADRLGTLERNILRIGVYELEEETVPAEVAINEAVLLAKPGERSTSSASSRVVGMPSISSSSSARTARAIAAGRSSSWTITLAISES